MSKSYKRLLKEAQAAMVAKVANAPTPNAKTPGAGAVAETAPGLKIELINADKIFSQTNDAQRLASNEAWKAASGICVHALPPEPPSANPSPLEAPKVATPGIDAPLAPNGPESQGTAFNEAPAEETTGVEAGGGKEAQVPETGPETPSWQARVYARPLNPRMRLIEFLTGPRKGEHGQLWIKDTSLIMLNWRVWVKPDVNRPTPAGLHWVLDGDYNWRGIRVK